MIFIRDLVLKCLLATVLARAWPTLGAESVLKDFVTVQGDQLREGDRPFRFLSFDVPNLHLIEDNMVFETDNPWRLPDRFEIADALESIRQMGGTVVRMYVLSVARPNDPPGAPRHVLGPGRFNEEAFRTLDAVLEAANEKGVRLIIPFVDNWSWWGGRPEYAGFRSKSKDEFWTDPQIISDFKQTVEFVVTRKNTLTGVPYNQDKAILCWETGNELQSPISWTRQIAAYVKTLDRNHPVMDGFHTSELREESLAAPEVDIVTTHHYPGSRKTFGQLIRENAAKARGRKAYVVGEFGFVETRQMADAIQAVMESGTAGALAWSLRFHNRDGGYYWHHEPVGGNKYKAFHWPGSTTGDGYDERGFMALMRQKAFEIQGLAVPAIRPPGPPRLLAIQDAGAITWQGSVGAACYDVERAPAENGSWVKAGEGVDDTAVQYRPLFADTNADEGRWFYHVIARNVAGSSGPSNVVGPVQITDHTLVDEMADFSLMASRRSDLEVKTLDCRKVKEDIHRVAGQAGGFVVYSVPGAIHSCKVYAFFPGEVKDFQFSISADGQTFVPVNGTSQVFSGGANDYGYWKAASFECRPKLGLGRTLKIEFGTQAEVSRIEIRYGR
jgi:mannan endo-1,4-beta-mannosidase